MTDFDLSDVQPKPASNRIFDEAEAALASFNDEAHNIKARIERDKARLAEIAAERDVFERIVKAKTPRTRTVKPKS